MQILKINFLLLLLVGNLSATYIKPTYIFKQLVNKHSLRVGDSFTLSLILRSQGLEDSEIPEVFFEDFRTVKVEDASYRDKNKTWVESLNYTLQTKKAGKFQLKAQEAKVEYLDAGYKGFNNKFKYLHKQTLQSNSVQINVLPLPKNIEVNGLYELSATVNKTQTDKYHPIIYTVTLTGDGNLETLDKLQLQIKNAKVYAEHSVKRDSIIMKKFEILCDKSIVIPALSLEYFNQIMEEVRTLSTNSFAIKVFSSSINSPQKKESSYNYIYILALVFLLLFFALKYLKFFTPNLKKQKLKALKRCKTKNELLKKVAIHLGKSKKLDELIYELEQTSEKDFIKIKKRILYIFNISGL